MQCLCGVSTRFGGRLDFLAAENLVVARVRLPTVILPLRNIPAVGRFVPKAYCLYALYGVTEHSMERVLVSRMRSLGRRSTHASSTQYRVNVVQAGYAKCHFQPS